MKTLEVESSNNGIDILVSPIDTCIIFKDTQVGAKCLDSQRTRFTYVSLPIVWCAKFLQEFIGNS